MCDLLGTCKPPPPQCSDGFDNDRDGVTDLADAGCTSAGDAWEYDVAPDLGTAVTGPIPADRTLGFNSSLSLWDSGVTPQQEVALVERAGGSAQRLFVQWRVIEPSGPGTLEHLDRVDALYQQLTDAGVQPVIGLFAAPAWAACKRLELLCRARVGDGTRNSPPRWDFILAYASVVARLAKRYPKALIEPWNEPNHAAFWEDGAFPDPARMAQMQCAAYNAIKGVNPAQIVTSPGLVWVDAYRTPDGRGAGLLEYLSAMYSGMGRVCWDRLALHVYPGSRYDGPDSQPARLFQMLRNVRPRYGDDTRIWVGELGATTSGDGENVERFSEAEQAAVVDGTVGELLAAPEVEAVFVHTLRDHSTERQSWSSPDYGFGLLEEAAGPFPPPKRAYCTLVGRAGNTYPGC